MVAMQTALILSILDRPDLVIVGAEDRYRVRLYRSQVEEATQELPDQAWSTADKRSPCRCMSQADKLVGADLEKSESHAEDGNQKSKIRSFLEFEWLSGWRWEPVSTIRRASLFPWLAIILWLIAFFSMPAQAPLSE
jgi:hypothetical protein